MVNGRLSPEIIVVYVCFSEYVAARVTPFVTESVVTRTELDILYGVIRKPGWKPGSRISYKNMLVRDWSRN